MTIKVEIDPEALISKETDSRGRLTLGSKYADQEETVLVVSTDEDAGDEGGDE